MFSEANFSRYFYNESGGKKKISIWSKLAVCESAYGVIFGYPFQARLQDILYFTTMKTVRKSDNKGSFCTADQQHLSRIKGHFSNSKLSPFPSLSFPEREHWPHHGGIMGAYNFLGGWCAPLNSGGSRDKCSCSICRAACGGSNATHPAQGSQWAERSRAAPVPASNHSQLHLSWKL